MRTLAAVFISLVLFPGIAIADTGISSTDIVWILISASLVFLMQAGFALLESGMSRAKNAINVMMKNYTDVCIGSLLFWAVGFGIMFGDNPSGLYGTSAFGLSQGSDSEFTFLLFQTMFAATAVTICSGAMAERTRYNAYLICAAAIVTIIYPVFGSWVWGGTYGGQGWLAELGFIDFAGSTVVHSLGAWCALAGVIAVGPRTGRFDQAGNPRNIPGHNLSLVALGGFILWFGWFGFNGGSALSASENIGSIILNTHLSAAAGAGGTLLILTLMQRPVLLTSTVNGSIAGLVGITAGCATMEPVFAIITGVVSGIIATLGQDLMLRWRLDDVVSAIPVHGFAGAWGTIAAGLFFAGDMFDMQRVSKQAIGVVAAFLWAFPLSLLVFTVIRYVAGLRSSKQHEQSGLDCTEHNEIGYPEFQQNITFRQEP
ncbi:ammonium transporter [Thalassolituus sp.]|uniref:ammonium transporter n=1 Tax=Thalassolituus sp. TaxID=2030822 RepID=UPI003518EE27